MHSNYSQNFWINLIGFNLIWYLCVFIGNPALWWVLLLLFLHLLFHSRPLSELAVVFVLGLLGFSIDFLLTLLGFFKFDFAPYITPVWLLLLWFSFCATLRQSLCFFTGKPWMGALFGAIGGSSSYVGAAFVGAVSFGNPLIYSALVIALIWAVLFPCLTWLSKQIGDTLCMPE